MEQMIPGSLELWAQLQPEAPAIVTDGASMSYGEWNDAADRVADHLHRAGITAGARVGMRFRLRPEWFVVHRALGKLGAQQVTVNWRLTPSEAAYILTDSLCVGLACDDVDVSDWAALKLSFLVTLGQEEHSPGIRYEDALALGEPEPRFGPVRPPLIVYTSGTTGKPKGVPPLDGERADVERVSRYYKGVLAVPPLPEGVRTLMTLPVHHAAGPAVAASTCELGGSVTLLDKYDPKEALRLIDEHRLQSWLAVPTMLLRLQALPPDELERFDLSSLMAVQVGAAAVPTALKRWVSERLGAGVLWESYGCSEAGMLTYLAPDAQPAKLGSSGIPYDEVEIRIVDEEWHDLPPDTTGEIAVRTPVQLDRYLGRERLGPETLSGDGFYRTGDVGHLDEDGYLYITDRIKDMIVAGGSNIYPAEIEAALVEHAGVADAAVIGIPHDDFGEQVLAFIVPRPGAELADEAILDFLGDRIARYKLPRRFVFLESLPMNPMGKVTKNVLREPFWAGRARSV